MIGDVKYRLSAWLKNSSRGKFMSIAATPEERQGDAPAPTPKATAKPAASKGFDKAVDDQIPF